MLDIDKLKLDPIFYSLYLKRGEQYIYDSGYFEETLMVDSDYEGEEFSIPTFNIINNSKDSENNCILVTSGCYNPIHQGHIDMMKVAKSKAEELGYNVINGFFCPAHEEYLKTKTDKVLDIFRRTELIYNKIKENDCLNWLDVNINPGLYWDCDTNFTKIITQLQKNISKLFPALKYTVIYVCGTDKYYFYRAFENTDIKTMIVSRGKEDYNNSNGIKLEINFNSKGKTYFICSDNSSSSSVERLSMVLPKHKKKELNLRVSNKELLDVRTTYIIEELDKHFSKINLIMQEDQINDYIDMFHAHRNIISLDSQIDGDYNLRLSRIYDSFGYRYLGFHIWDPEFYKQIPKGKKMILYDDDICGGSTMNFAKKYLESVGVTITGYFTFNYTKENEVLDLRDFLFDAKDGGLLIMQPDGELVRKPYILPWCNVYERCSILHGKSFSDAIHKINKNYEQEFKQRKR